MGCLCRERADGGRWRCRLLTATSGLRDAGRRRPASKMPSKGVSQRFCPERRRVGQNALRWTMERMHSVRRTGDAS